MRTGLFIQRIDIALTPVIRYYLGEADGRKLAPSQRLAIYAELIAGIAHQLNNPLIGVVNFSSLLLEKIDSKDETWDLAETIQFAAQKCRASDVQV